MPVIEADCSRLVEATDGHFAWLLGQARSPRPALRLPPGGVDAPEILRVLRSMTRRLHAAGSRGSWLVIAGDEIVGLCGYKQPPTFDGRVEIDYGVAECRRNVGHATRAVTAMVRQARLDPALSTLVAATASANLASQRVLEKNGFEQTGFTNDPVDIKLIWWRLNLV